MAWLFLGLRRDKHVLAMYLKLDGSRVEDPSVRVGLEIIRRRENGRPLLTTFRIWPTKTGMLNELFR